MDTPDRPLTPPTTENDRPVLGPFQKSLSKLSQQNSIPDLVRVAEEEDLASDAKDQEDANRFFIVAPLVLGYLILDELAPARYALTRLPINLLGNPLSVSLLNLLAATWHRNHPHVYQRAQELMDLVSASSFFSQPLATLIRTLTEQFTQEFRERTFALVSRAYTSISLSALKSYLGDLPPEHILSVAQQKGWKYDAAAQILSPVVHAPRTIDKSFAPSTLDTFRLVTTTTAALEGAL
ncbi:hypothetical protein M422DRAFT_30423 [Sphaerobolus stellatus SS14]|uniref:CSN8/PSMD8/EIF3K domain-containing protein n=1 Tax=Sphaerobolus stellatus (strain SS14) TaxID=990650 RepID=A0A0C9W064_SPHS4|nr:hypothetical protein M422DRAFT_30423 [Sphaerobolus stellatus SS14]